VALLAFAAPRIGTAQAAPATPDLLASPLADSLAPLLVFPPATQRWFVAASRAGRLLLDVGRTDAETKKRTDRIPVIAALAEARGTVRRGDAFLLRGTWGREVVRVTGFDVWNGRIVATLEKSPAADSAAKAKGTALASAWRLLRDEAPATDSQPIVVRCPRDSLAKALAPRIARVRDSLVTVVRALVPRITVYQQARRPKPALLRTTHTIGCGDTPWVMVIASLRGENTEWVAERAVLLSPDGTARGVRLDDLRFEGHEALRAFDADGDGRDDLGTRAVAEASGGTSILRWDTTMRRFTRLAVGFQWEYR
jgi:hypothetical protein